MLRPCVGRVGWASPSRRSCAPDAREPVSRRGGCGEAVEAAGPMEASAQPAAPAPAKKEWTVPRARRTARPTSWRIRKPLHALRDRRPTQPVRAAGVGARDAPPFRPRAAARPAWEPRPPRRGRPEVVPPSVAEGAGRRRPLRRPDGRARRPPEARDVPGREGVAVDAHADRPLLRHRSPPDRAGGPYAPFAVGLSAHVSQLPVVVGQRQVAITSVRWGRWPRLHPRAARRDPDARARARSEPSDQGVVRSADVRRRHPPDHRRPRRDRGVPQRHNPTPAVIIPSRASSLGGLPRAPALA